jgi:hypothetical protein
LFDSFDVEDELLAEICWQQGNEEERDNPQIDTINRVEHLYEQAATPIWGNSSVSVISATIVFMNMAVIHGCSNAYMDELFGYLSTSLLLPHNKFPNGH